MDPNKKAHVIELITKSLSLSISEEDIISTLVDANLTKADAMKLISEAKDGASKNPVPVTDEKKPIFQEAPNLSIGDQISKQLGLESNLNKGAVKVEVKNEMPKLEIKSSVVDQKAEALVLDKKEEPKKGGLFSKFTKKKEVEKPIVDQVPIKEESKEIVEPILEIKETKIDPKDLLINQLEKNVNSKATVSKIKEPLSESKKAFDEIQNKMTPKIEVPKKDSNFEDMWKKGIVVAVNSKLTEMKKLKDEVDELVSSKVDTAVKKETNQFKVLLESQKNLIISSNESALNQKQKEISLIIDSKIVDLKKQSSELNKNVELIEQSKATQEKSMADIKETLEQAKKTKVQLLIEMNSELIKSKSQAQEFIDKAQKHIDELDQRVNKTLELEKNIAEGMLEQAEQKIEQLAMKKADDLLGELELELNKLRTIEKNINLDSIEQKIKLLDEFKKQFLVSIEENLSKVNVAIKELNTKNEDLTKELDAKSLVIDAKIEELTKFEKLFTDNLEKALKKSAE